MGVMSERVGRSPLIVVVVPLFFLLYDLFPATVGQMYRARMVGVVNLACILIVDNLDSCKDCLAIATLAGFG